MLPSDGLVDRHRACSFASDVLVAIARSNPTFQSSRRGEPPGFAPTAASSKAAALSKPGRLPSTSALSSVSVRFVRLACASRRPPPVELSHRLPALTFACAAAGTRKTGSSRTRHRTRIRGPASSAAVQCPKRLDAGTSRRLLQSEQPTSTTTNHRIPDRSSSTQHPQLALGLEKSSGQGGGPIRRIGCQIRVMSRFPPSHEPCGPNGGFHLAPAELSRVRGGWVLATQRLLASLLQHARRKDARAL